MKELLTFSSKPDRDGWLNKNHSSFYRKGRFLILNTLNLTLRHIRIALFSFFYRTPLRLRPAPNEGNWVVIICAEVPFTCTSALF